MTAPAPAVGQTVTCGATAPAVFVTYRRVCQWHSCIREPKHRVWARAGELHQCVCGVPFMHGVGGSGAR